MSMAEIGELIHQAGFGLASWDAVNTAIVDHIPGSFAGISSQNRENGACNFVSIAGVPEQSIKDYADHYAAINPWNPHWERFKSSVLMRSVTSCPVEQFSKTEFVNDWLQPLQKSSVSFGIKLDATTQDNLNIIVHIAGRQAEHEATGLLLMRQQIGNLGRAVEMNRFLSDHIGKSVAAAALVERGSSIGFVVDYNLRIIEANGAAAAAFSAGALLKGKSNVACFNDDALHQWFTRNVRSLITGTPVASTTHILLAHDHVWHVKLARIREHDPRTGNRFFPSRHLVLALVKDIRDTNSGTADLAAFKAFGLTPAEIRMCQVLVQGYTMNEIADRLGIKIETARHRMKAIFQKTGTNRQTALMSLLINSI